MKDGKKFIICFCMNSFKSRRKGWKTTEDFFFCIFLCFFKGLVHHSLVVLSSPRTKIFYQKTFWPETTEHEIIKIIIKWRLYIFRSTKELWSYVCIKNICLHKKKLKLKLEFKISSIPKLSLANKTRRLYPVTNQTSFNFNH